MITNNSAQNLDANSTQSKLQAATFSEKPESNQDRILTEKGLLMSRIITGIPVGELSGGYDSNTQLPLERGVAKIACFFAKESESTQAEITGITVSGATNMGNVFPTAVRVKRMYRLILRLKRWRIFQSKTIYQLFQQSGQTVKQWDVEMMKMHKIT